MRVHLILFICLSFWSTQAQNPTWKLWASGLPSGVYPRMVVAPNHDIFYTLLGTGVQLGYIYKANTQDSNPIFQALPQIPRPSTIQNNIVALGYNHQNEVMAGIYRTDQQQPWLFRFDHQKMAWDTATSPGSPTLGGHCMATSPNGTIYVGTRWAYIYKSTDGGRTFEVIDESSLIKMDYPCYYPSFNGSDLNGAIFCISIDKNGRVYAGTETAGVIYSDDEGKSWHPADLFACLPGTKTQKDTSSIMRALNMSGNVAAIGFTKEQQLVWSGPDMWQLGWKNKLGFADLHSKIVHEVKGLPDYLIQTGQQVSKIVTSENGQMFFHSGNSTNSSQIGIYTSRDGINWKLFNDGITGQNDGPSQGSLAADGNKVFMATRDGKVWIFEDTLNVSQTDQSSHLNTFTIYPNPASDQLHLKLNSDQIYPLDEILIQNLMGVTIKKFSNTQQDHFILNISDLKSGCYIIKWRGSYKFIKI